MLCKFVLGPVETMDRLSLHSLFVFKEWLIVLNVDNIKAEARD